MVSSAMMFDVPSQIVITFASLKILAIFSSGSSLFSELPPKLLMPNYATATQMYPSKHIHFLYFRSVTNAGRGPNAKRTSRVTTETKHPNRVIQALSSKVATEHAQNMDYVIVIRFRGIDSNAILPNHSTRSNAANVRDQIIFHRFFWP